MVGDSSRPSKNSKAVREHKATGNKAMQNGAFQKAIRFYSKALELDPANAILYSNRSAAHFNIRQFSESLEDAESAIICDPVWWKAYKRKGLALIHMQRYEDAIEALEEGLKIVGKNAEMEKNLEFARACQEQAQNLYILPEANMMQRLESVPVFIVTDNVGQPFFVTYDDGQQVCTFYFDKQDAVATLDWIKAENPSLGDTARVIHITLHQAFVLAQETQKQYYEETMKAAAEEDRLAAVDAEKKVKTKPKIGKLTKAEHQKATDIDGQEDDWDVSSGDDSQDKLTTDPASAEPEEAVPSGESSVPKPDNTTSDPAPETQAEPTDAEPASAPADVEEPTQAADQPDPEKKPNGTTDDEDKPKEEDAADAGEKSNASKTDEDALVDDNAPLSFQFRPELRQVQVAVELLNKHPNPPVRPILRDPPSVRKAKAEAKAKAMGEAKKSDEETASDENDPSNGQKDEKDGEAKAEESTTGSEEKGDVKVDYEDDEDVELTVDNFNGIPIFQAKGLTLLQKNKQLIPLFFSKWDLEAAWTQLKSSNAIEVPGKCDVEVGTLEDVLRRMSESKTDEFESVFFVPSRESMKAINVKFPLDELSGPSGAANGRRPMVKKAEFSKAKQIAARGGTKEEIREAIREDLEKYVERQKMAEIVSQIEHARRVSGVGSVGGLGSVGLGGTADTGAEKEVDRIESVTAEATTAEASATLVGSESKEQSGGGQAAGVEA